MDLKRFWTSTLVVCLLTAAVAAMGAEGKLGDAVKPATGKTEAGKPAPAAVAKSTPAPKDAAQKQGKVLLPSSASWTWWAVDKAGHPVLPPVVLKGDSISWAAPSAAGLQVYVLNNSTGNVAVLKNPGEEQKLVDADFGLVRRLVVKITAKSGKPVQTASILLKDSQGQTATRVIDASCKGSAEFFDVAIGKVTLSVGSGKVNISQDVTLDRTRSEASASAEVILPGDVPTVSASAGAEGGKPAPKPSAGAGSLIQSVISLLLFVAFVYVVVLYLRNKRLTLKAVLEKAGVPLEENLPPEAVPAAAPEVPALDPEQVGPPPGSPVTSAPAASAAPPSGPRLVGVAGTYAGSVFSITADVAIIGREATCDIPLPLDSTSSRRHARITKAGEVVTIHDEGSSNGTMVNGQKIVEHQLGSGDDVQIGSTRFRFEA